DALRSAYRKLGAAKNRPNLLVAGYFGEVTEALPVLADSPVEGLAMDLVAGPGALNTLPNLSGLRNKTLIAGLIEGRNIWRTDLDRALETAEGLRGIAGELSIGTSCSLLHVPYDVEAETDIDPQVKSWLAFAEQKLG